MAQSMSDQFREKLNLPPVGESSVEEQIKKLEMVGELNAANEAIESLQAQLQQKERDHVAEISTIKKQSIDPIQTAIDILQGSAQITEELANAKALIEELQAQRAQDEADFKEFEALSQQQIDAGIELKNQRDLAEKEINKANGIITKLQAQLAAAQKQYKEINQYDPKRLQKQLNEAKKKNRELTESNAKLREQASLNKKASQALIDIKAKNEELEAKCIRTQSALEEAARDLNDNKHAATFLDSEGEWEIHGSDQGENTLVIVDKVSGIERPYVQGEGFTKVRKPPASVIKRTEQTFERVKLISSVMDMEEYASCAQASE